MKVGRLKFLPVYNCIKLLWIKLSSHLIVFNRQWDRWRGVYQLWRLLRWLWNCNITWSIHLFYLHYLFQAGQFFFFKYRFFFSLFMLILSWWLFAVVLSVLAGHEFAVLEFYFWMKNIYYYPLWCFICAINLYLVSELLLISLQISLWFWRTIVHVYIFALRWWIDILACLLSGVSFAYLTWLCKVCYFMLFSMEINIS